MARPKGSTQRKDFLMELVIQDILRGKLDRECVTKLQTDKYGMGKIVSWEGARQLVKKAKQTLIADMKEETENLKQKMLARILDVYNESRDARDRQNALKSLEIINKLLGLNEGDKMKAKMDLNKNKFTISFGSTESKEENNEEEETVEE